MTMPSSAETLHRRAGAVVFASQTGQSTGALLSLAGVAAPGPGHPRVARAGLATIARRGSSGPAPNVTVRSTAGH